MGLLPRDCRGDAVCETSVRCPCSPAYSTEAHFKALLPIALRLISCPGQSIWLWVGTETTLNKVNELLFLLFQLSWPLSPCASPKISPSPFRFHTLPCPA